jgi:hypothetical protein
MKYLFILLLIVSCGSRKTNQLKEVEKIKSAEINTSDYFSMFRKLEAIESYDRGYVYTREKDGLKETFAQNNKSTTSVKTIDSVHYSTAIINKTVTTYKTIKDKKTQSDGVSVWVWVVGLFLVFLFAILKWNKELFRFWN